MGKVGKIIDIKHNGNLIEFTEEYLNKGYVNLIYEIDSKGQRTQRYTYPSEEEEKELKRNGITVECHPVKLDPDEEIALKQIDLMKNEILNMYRFKQSNGRDRFDLAPSKAGVMHDDKAYVLGLLSYQLMLLRRDHIVNKKIYSDHKQILDKLIVSNGKHIDKIFG